MRALEKLTLAYLVLQKKYEKAKKANDDVVFAMFELQEKYKKVKEQKAFLQADRNKWFDAYNELNKSNEALTIEQAEQMHNLKECIEELEGQCVELQAKLEALQVAPKEPTNTIYFLELLSENNHKQYIADIKYRKSGDGMLGTNSNIEAAKKFASHAEIKAFLGSEFPMDLVAIHVLQPAPTDGYEAEKRVCRAGFKASETPNDAADKTAELYHTIYDNPA